MEDIGYTGQRLHNKTFKIKTRTGNDIYKGISDAIAGEIMYDVNTNGVCIAKGTSTTDSHKVAAIFDISEDQKIPYNSHSGSFNGTNSYITGAASTGFDFSGNIALSLFFKPNQLIPQTLFTTKNYRIAATDGFLIDCIGAAPTVRLIGFNSSTQTFRDDNVATFVQGEWNHFALSFNITDAIISVYMNGILSKEVPSTGVSMVDIGTGFYSGGSTIAGGTPTTQWLDGNMADIAIFNKELSSSEVKALYGNGLSNPKSLIAKFNPIQHIALDNFNYDYSANRFHNTSSNLTFSEQYPGI